MLKYVALGFAIIATVGAVMIYVDNRDAANVQRGIDIQRAENIATINQQIAERRIRDATFNKMDVKQLCLDAGLEWVFDDEKQRSRCQ